MPHTYKLQVPRCVMRCLPGCCCAVYHSTCTANKHPISKSAANTNRINRTISNVGIVQEVTGVISVINPKSRSTSLPRTCSTKQLSSHSSTTMLQASQSNHVASSATSVLIFSSLRLSSSSFVPLHLSSSFFSPSVNPRATQQAQSTLVQQTTQQAASVRSRPAHYVPRKFPFDV